jgi:hypothetical protein
MNDAAAARHWTEFLAGRKEIAGGERLLQQFTAGTITRICGCGCSSFDIKVPRDSGLQPLLPAKGHRGGCALSMAFTLSDRTGSVEFDVFLDAEGFLAGVDVACNSNSEPVPSNPRLVEPPYHVHGPLARTAEKT